MIAAGQTASHSMDKNTTAGVTSEEATRESLIAISYTLPSEPKTGSSENPVKGTNWDEEAEKHMSELISISSNRQSPKTTTSPAAQGEPKS